MRDLKTNREAQANLGFADQRGNWKNLIESLAPLAERIESLTPAPAGDGPNPEYPWPRDNPVFAPLEHEFAVWRGLQIKSSGRRLRKLLADPLASAESYL